jgi:two-component system alkaline phosphatase synthesis response regulator PhoP
MNDTKKHSVLIVEDERPQLSVLVDKFTCAGFEVFSAIDGVEGLQVALEKKPDIIITDIIMPRLDGVGMVQKIREDEWGKSVKIIMLTNLSNKESEVLESGVYDYFVKVDMSIKDLLEHVQEKIGEMEQA